MLPKPAIPSLIPDIVATALLLRLSSSSLPISQRTIAITIVAPFSNKKKLVIQLVRYNVWVFVCTDTSSESEIAPSKQPTVCTGDRKTSRSEIVPIKIDPIIPPTDPRDIMSPA